MDKLTTTDLLKNFLLYQFTNSDNAKQITDIYAYASGISEIISFYLTFYKTETNKMILFIIVDTFDTNSILLVFERLSVREDL